MKLRCRQLFVRSLYYVVIQFYTKINKSLSLLLIWSQMPLIEKLLGFNSLDVSRRAKRNTKPIEYIGQIYSKFICLNAATKDQKKESVSNRESGYSTKKRTKAKK